MFGGRRLLTWLLVAAVAFRLPRETWGGPLDMLVGTLVGASAGMGLFHSLRFIPRPRPLEPPARTPGPTLRLPVAGSILEELAWRGFVLQALRTHVSLPLSVATATVGFAILHFDSQHWRGVTVHALTGLSFAGVVIATGTVMSAVAAHVVYNLLVSRNASRPGVQP
jgi:membrane protease YdiL (CAAX protease family)